ncbi:MAG: prepilin-type N-terminal cleavage/methylation domain-containing protein [Planctomycetes bacterium]|nr:prepilin-type N-terminal cleavage/methylation domain-containing protein [Planctomycetota bacterium]
MRPRAGFSLIEVLAAVLLLAVALTTMLQLRNQALGSAINSRSRSIASRLALQLMHRVEAARVPDLFDGFQGDFADEGFPEFTYTVGLGDGSAYSGGTPEDDGEAAWRQAAENKYEAGSDQEKPELTRVFLNVAYPDADGSQASFDLEGLLPTWAVYQDFELWEELWAGNLPPEVD